MSKLKWCFIFDKFENWHTKYTTFTQINQWANFQKYFLRLLIRCTSWLLRWHDFTGHGFVYVVCRVSPRRFIWVFNPHSSHLFRWFLCHQHHNDFFYIDGLARGAQHQYIALTTVAWKRLPNDKLRRLFHIIVISVVRLDHKTSFAVSRIYFFFQSILLSACLFGRKPKKVQLPKYPLLLPTSSYLDRASLSSNFRWCYPIKLLPT